MTGKESSRLRDSGDSGSREHPLEGGQTDMVDELQEENDDLQEENDSLADGSSYRKEADGLDDLIDDGSNYREIAEAND